MTNSFADLDDWSIFYSQFGRKSDYIKGILFSDVDGTLWPNPTTDEGHLVYSKISKFTIFDNIISRLEEGYAWVFVSGNDNAILYHYLIEPILQELKNRGREDLFDSILLSPHGGSIIFRFVSTSSGFIQIADHNFLNKGLNGGPVYMENSLSRDIIEFLILEQFQFIQWIKKELLKPADQRSKRFNDANQDFNLETFPWELRLGAAWNLDPKDFNLDDTVSIMEENQSEFDKNLFRGIEVQRSTIDGVDQITAKGMPGSLRDDLFVAFKQKFPDISVSYKQAGRTTSQITSGVSKKDTIEYIYRSTNISPFYSVYFGDSFSPDGNDTPATEVEGITVFNVGKPVSSPKIINANTKWWQGTQLILDVMSEVDHVQQFVELVSQSLYKNGSIFFHPGRIGRSISSELISSSS